MPSKLKLEDITEGSPVELGSLNAEPVTIGREPDYGISIVSDAVSGEHGVLVPVGNHWIYKDLGSTNGSWVDGQQVHAGTPAIVRHGSTLQLADRLIRLSEVQGSSPHATPRSLLVFSRGEFVDEYLIPERKGRALVIGGSMADLKFDVDVHELPSLVVENRGDNVVAYSVSKEIVANYNGKPIDRSINLKDRDELVVENFRVIVNDPPVAMASIPAPAQSYAPHGASDPADFSAEFMTPSGAFIPAQKTVVSIPFGRQNPGEQRDSFAWGEEELSQSNSGVREVHPSMRRAFEQDEPQTLDRIEDKIVIIVGGLLLLGLIVLLVIWALWG